MRSERHLIQRQVIEVATAGFEGAEFQNALARSYWERTVPELERLFDRIVGPDEYLRLDRLEIDLGLLAGRDWESSFRSRLVGELLRTLIETRATRMERGSPPPPGARSAATLQQFLYFLANGRLPWWGTKPWGTWTDVLSPVMATAGWGDLLDVLRADVRARTRCIDSVTDDFLADAMARWAGLEAAARACVLLAPRTAPRIGRNAWRRCFWGALLEWVAAGGAAAAGGPALLRELLALRKSLADAVVDGELAPQRRPESPAPDGALPTDVDWQALPKPWNVWAVSAAHAMPAAWAESLVESPHRKPTRPQDLASRTGAQRPDGLHSAPKRAAADAGTDPIYLSGAGAVLLHPFLETLFRERGLLSACAFTNMRARDQAIHLVGLMSFGAPAAEHDLLLAKLLCGCPFEEPVEPVELDDDDRAACDALLGAVLRHWSVPRSNSPQWLRDQFLVRDGKLEPVNSGWRLTVESRAQDVLLARLPWGFGVVSQPWLQEKIFVQWLD